MTDKQTPIPLTTTTTPSGLVIDYFTEPRRMYTIDGVEVPSVTTVLDVLDKPALPWWGMTMGVEGIIELVKRGELVIAQHEGVDVLAVRGDDGGLYIASKDNVVPILTKHHLTTNHVRDKAGDRGQAAHDALELWGTVGRIPQPADYPEHEQGYIEGLRKFILDLYGAMETEAMEIVVGSKKHGFAGRYDWRATLTAERRLVASALTTKGEPFVRGPKYTTVPAGTRLLLDLKTSKGIYSSHLLQLEGYEGASIEGGHEPTDARAVVHVTPHGLYEFKRAKASYDDFLAILNTYKALNNVKEVM